MVHFVINKIIIGRIWSIENGTGDEDLGGDMSVDDGTILLSLGRNDDNNFTVLIRHFCFSSGVRNNGKVSNI
jgi:hypothetical protein